MCIFYYYIMSYHIILYNIILYYIISYHFILYHIIPFYIRYIFLCHHMLLYNIISYHCSLYYILCIIVYVIIVYIYIWLWIKATWVFLVKPKTAGRCSFKKGSWRYLSAAINHHPFFKIILGWVPHGGSTMAWYIQIPLGFVFKPLASKHISW